ncbi:MAG: superoxide dismutase [Rhodothermales bacterium]|nr:superoxide dismutase [Rhodothermales bacterium]
MAFAIDPLPYAADALEPTIDAETMTIHHDKHHQAYCNNLNDAVAATPELAGKTAEEIIANLDAVPESVRTKVRNNGGGFVNHNLFWKGMSPDGGGQPSGALAEAIDAAFGSFDAFKAKFEDAAKGQFGSGWAWLCYGDGQLHVKGYPNQDSPYMIGHLPILGLDVWEHAYYLKYQNKRPDYVGAYWNVVNWPEAERLYAEATKG